MQFLNHHPIDWLPRCLRVMLKSGISILLVLFISGMYWFGNPAFDQPDPEELLATFFKEPFVIMIGLYIAWYISSFKCTPSRVEEYIFLNSLPISSKKICGHFITLDLVRYSWVPGIGIFLYLGFLSASPVFHLFRLTILTVFLFFLFIMANSTFHLFISLKRVNLGEYIYPIRNNPIIMAAIVLGYAISQLTLIVIPALASGYTFLIVLGLLLIASYSFLILVRIFFNKWQRKNLALQMRKDIPLKPWSYWFHLKNLFEKYPVSNPLLFKNIVRIKREKNPITLVLTIIFLAGAYLISMNNENIEESLFVLFAILCIYGFLFAVRSISQFSPDEESPGLVYLYPIRERDFYFSIFIPAIGWMAVIIVLSAIFMLISGGSILLIGIFILKSLLAASTFLLVACNYALASYPDMKKARKKFFYWTLSLLILNAVFFRFLIVIVGIMIIFSFLPLRNIKFYKSV